MADRKPWPETPLVAYPNLGGMDTTSAPGLLGPAKLALAQNTIFSERKTWQKRSGLVTQNSTALGAGAPVKTLIDYWRAGSSGAPSQRLVAAAGASIFSSNDAGVSFSDITGALSIPTDSIVTSAVVGDVLVMAFNATIPYSWNQTGNVASLSGTPPNGNIVAQHLNRAWMNEKTDPHKIYWTGPTGSGGGDPTRWSLANGGGSFYVEEDDGDPVGITSLFQLNDQLYVGKQTKIYRIEGNNNDTFRPVLVSKNIGIISHNMVVPVGLDALFPSLLGFHSLAQVAQTGGLVREAQISRDIHTTFQSDIALGRLKHGWGVFIPYLNGILWAIPGLGQTTNSQALFYSLTNNQWTIFINFKCDAFCARYNSSTNKVELYTGGNTGMVYKYSPGVFADYMITAIDMVLQSGHLYPDGVFGHQWMFKKFNLLVYPKGDHTVTLTYRTDEDRTATGTPVAVSRTRDQGFGGTFVPLGATFILGTAFLGEEAFIHPLSFDLRGKGQAIEWELQNNALNEDLEIAGYYIETEPAAPIRG